MHIDISRFPVSFHQPGPPLPDKTPLMVQEYREMERALDDLDAIKCFYLRRMAWVGHSDKRRFFHYHAAYERISKLYWNRSRELSGYVPA